VLRWIEAGASWPEDVVLQKPPAATAVAGAAEDSETADVADPSAISFNKDIRPILADNCYACHGPDRNKRKMGLRLDREDIAKAPLPSGEVAIVPGDPDKSALFHRVTDPDEEARMPFKDSGKPRLTACAGGSSRERGGSHTGRISSRCAGTRPPCSEPSGRATQWTPSSSPGSRRRA
jgi:hypothetical protein